MSGGGGEGEEQQKLKKGEAQQVEQDSSQATLKFGLEHNVGDGGNGPRLGNGPPFTHKSDIFAGL